MYFAVSPLNTYDQNVTPSRKLLLIHQCFHPLSQLFEAFTGRMYCVAFHLNTHNQKNLP